jgi:hypothetical protein
MLFRTHNTPAVRLKKILEYFDIINFIFCSMGKLFYTLKIIFVFCIVGT